VARLLLYMFKTEPEIPGLTALMLLRARRRSTKNPFADE
jgi:predicted RNA polymerase sigma factor